MVDYSSFSDRKLVRAVRLSNKKAFKSLYHRYYHALYRFIWYRVKSTELAMDFVQEVFIRIWEKRKNLDPQKSIKAYLYSIAYNLVIDYLKKNARQKSYINEIIHQQISSSALPIDMEIDVQKAIEDLPQSMKIVFCLSRDEGLKYSEIADVCGISVKTVEYRISRALTLIHKKLS